ncbi:MAG TPA: TonB-dependent receptor [Candidatus Acidoferrum sp.]|nr:TonB-dependent receptor [Candidatus Acidoferrum sp.]
MRTNKLRTAMALVCVLVCAMGGVAVQAQSGRGTISGRVTDTSGGVLQGATIELDPAGLTRVSDAQGEFTFTGVAAGSYTVTYNFVGMEPHATTVNVKAGELVRADAVLHVESNEQQVIVTAERAHGEADALNREKSADNLLQVLPSEVIRSLPNANMADALGRLPSVTLERDEGEGKYVQIRGTEPRLTNVTLDGVNVASPEAGIRQIKLDTIPADLVESVEINKTLQANQDADGIGGSVNLVTKTAGERPTISFSGAGGLTPIAGTRHAVEGTGTLGQRFGAQKRFGALVGGSYDWNGRGIDDLEPVPDQAVNLPGAPTQFDAIDIREYRYYRSRWGLGGSLDYKPTDGSTLYIHGLYSDFKNFGERFVYSLNDNTTGVQLLGANGCATDANGVTVQPCGGVPSFNTQIRRPDYAIASLIAGGKHVFATRWFAWDISGGRSRQIENGDPTASFGSTLATSACQFDPAATKSIFRPQWTPNCFTEAYDPTTLQLSNIRASRGLTAQVNLQATGAIGQRYSIGGHTATIEVGGRFRNAHKFDDSVNTEIDPTGTVLLSQFANSFANHNYYDGSYRLGPNPKFDDVFAFFSANPGQFTAAPDDISPQFDLDEKVSAGYVMNTIDLNGKLRIIAGLRIEGTNLDTATPTFDSSGNFIGLTKANGSYVKVLPSASLRYALTNNTNLRLVYGRGLSRPDPQDIAQAVSFTVGGTQNTAALGNPNLKAETADNFDVLVQHYLNPFGGIEAGFFYKRLYDPIVTEETTINNFQPTPTAPLGTYRVTQPINAGSAWVYGFEASYVQHLTFLPGMLRSFGISANYGYTNSQANGLPGRSDHPRLVRSAPHTWNVSPTFDYKRFSYRAGLSYNAANIFSYSFKDGLAGGVNGPLSDTYFYPHLQIDMQGSMGVGHGLSVIGYILNVNNEVFGFYNGSSQYMIQREYYKPTYSLGLRWNPTFEKK